MEKQLTILSDEFYGFIKEIIIKLWFQNIVQRNEKMEIFGSVKYWLALESESDVDIRIVSKNPRESFVQKVEYFSKEMMKDKLLKKMVINNFFDSYPVFEEKKWKLITAGDNSRFFLIDISYYLNNDLEKKINFQLHIAATEFKEPLPELLKLSIKEKEILLRLKRIIYRELPFFWNRSYLLYTWFLQWYKTKQKIKQYLIDNGFEKLIK